MQVSCSAPPRPVRIVPRVWHEGPPLAGLPSSSLCGTGARSKSAAAALAIITLRAVRTVAKDSKFPGIRRRLQDRVEQHLEKCPGCDYEFPAVELQRHMRTCCPYHLKALRAEKQRGSGNDEEEEDEEEAELTPEMAPIAEKAIRSIAKPELRVACMLRWGMDRGWKRRTPLEVGEMLGGRFMNNTRLVLNLVKAGQKCIPLVRDDPKKLDILYEDEDILVVNKPPHLRCTPMHRFVGGSLHNQLLGYLNPSTGSSPPYVVQRLDTGTSGVYICCKNSIAQKKVMSEWRGPKCQKEYLALARQDPERTKKHFKLLPAGEGNVMSTSAPIGPDFKSEHVAMQRVDARNGKKATTSFEALDRSRKVFLLKCILEESGRTHQVRVHAAHLGLPLIGDELYGDTEVNAQMKSILQRTALHMWRLTIPHPKTEKVMSFEAPLPQDFLQAKEALGLLLPWEKEEGRVSRLESALDRLGGADDDDEEEEEEEE